MSKRFTSLLVGALAVVLLGAPAQAQTNVRRVTGNKQLVHRVIKPGQYAEQHKAAMAMQEKERAAQEALVQTATPQQRQNSNVLRPELAIPTMRFGTFQNTLPARIPLRLATETIDEHGIIVAPAEGETKYYTREGSTFYYSSGWYYTSQGGHVEIVECEDGTVYIKDILSRVTAGTWVKGIKDGNTITVAYGQPLMFVAQYTATVDLKWSTYSSGFSAADSKTDDFVFVIDGNTLTLQGTAFPDEGTTYQIAGVWSDDNSLQGMDCETVFTLDEGFVPVSTELVELPANVETEEWYSLLDGKKGNVNVGFDGNDVYVQGLFTDFPESWIKGTIEDNTVVFAKLQFLGKYGSYDIFMTSADADDQLADFVMEYDPDAKTMAGSNLIANAAQDRIYYLEWIEAVAIQADEFTEPIIATGDPVEVPYTNTLTTEDEQAQLGIYDANNDNKTWAISSGVATYSYNSSEAADDWLVTPAVYLEEGKSYSFAFDVACASSGYPECVEVLMGTEAKASALTTVVIEPTTVDNTEFVTVENEEFSVRESGYYFFGIHAISDADMYRLYVDNIVIDLGVEPTSPAAPYISSVVADPYGLNKATITVIAPSTDIAGEPLTENIGAIAILRNGQEVKRFENVRPEDTKVFVDFVDQTGENKYQAVPYTADGKRGAKSQVASAYVGLDMPNFVENVKAVEQADGSVIITWDPVTTGLNGGPVVTDDIVYLVCTGEIINYGFFSYLEITGVVDATKGLVSHIALDNDDEQTAEQLFIIAYNGDMDDEAIEDYLYDYGDYSTQVLFFAGAPYELPYAEHFNDGLDNVYLIDYSDYADLGLSDENSDDEGYSLVFESYYSDEFAAYETGKIALNGANNPTLAFDVKSSNAQNKMRVQALTPDGKTNLLKVLNMDEDFKTVKISLANFANQPFIKLLFTVEFADDSEVLLDNVMVLDLLDYNLTAAINAPKSVKAGESADVTVTVKNFGSKAAENYTVKVFANDDQLFSEKITESLASFAKKEFTVEFPTTIFDDADDVTLSAEIIYALDMDDEDNAAETVISVKQSAAATPENVLAERTGDGVHLSWTAPTINTEGYIAIRHFNVTDEYCLLVDDITYTDINSEEVTEDFENGIPEGWTILDQDGDGYTWDLSDMADFDETSHSGTFCMRSDSYINQLGALTPDNWFISPKVSLSGTFSFWAWGLDPNYAAEVFQVYTSTDLVNFDPVSEEFVATGTMTEYNVNIDAGTVVGYNIYVDGELYDTTTDTSIDIAEVGAGNTFAVSAVYSNGKESRPVVVTVSASNQEITAIEQLVTNGGAVDVYSLDGRMVRRQATSLEGLRGAYIINGRTVIVK